MGSPAEQTSVNKARNLVGDVIKMFMDKADEAKYEKTKQKHANQNTPKNEDDEKKTDEEENKNKGGGGLNWFWWSVIICVVLALAFVAYYFFFGKRSEDWGD